MLMRPRHLTAPALLVALLAACSSAPGPVPVAAEEDDLAMLAGEWQGTYDSPAVGRHGTITFSLEAGADTAYGDVTMIPRGWNRPLQPAQDPAAAARDAPIPTVLQIRFVRVEDGAVTGTMQPYRDPDCGCSVYTTFTGHVKGDLIDGELLSRPGHGGSYMGTWQVVRKKEE
jgi:hypothetical protein